MRKWILLIVMCLIAADLSAQNKVFCEIVESNPNSKKVKVVVDFGQKREKSKAQQKLVNEDGELRIFNSEIDALNYMSELGWEFVQAYVFTSIGSDRLTSTDNEIHWLLCKTVEEGEDPYKGLVTKEEYKLKE